MIYDVHYSWFIVVFVVNFLIGTIPWMGYFQELRSSPTLISKSEIALVCLGLFGFVLLYLWKLIKLLWQYVVAFMKLPNFPE